MPILNTLRLTRYGVDSLCLVGYHWKIARSLFQRSLIFSGLNSRFIAKTTSPNPRSRKTSSTSAKSCARLGRLIEMKSYANPFLFVTTHYRSLPDFFQKAWGRQV